MTQVFTFLILIGLLGAVYYLTTVKIKPILKFFFFVVVGILSLTFILSLITFNPDRALSNAGGIVGYEVARFMLTHLGYTLSYATALLFFSLSILGLLKKLLSRVFGLVLGVYMFSVFLTLSLSIFFGFFQSGDTVMAISSWLVKYIGKTPSFLFLLLLSLASLYPVYPKFRLPSLRFRFPSIKLPEIRRKPREFEEKADKEEDLLPDLKPTGVQETEKKKSIFEDLKSLTEEETVSEEEVETPPPRLIESPPIPQTDALIPLLKDRPVATTEADREECERNARLIEEKLQEFGVKGKVVNYYPGPVVTRYEYEPAPGIKLSKIVGLSDDLALRMKSNKIRIIAPLPDKGLIGIEVPNKKRRIVYFKELVDQPEFKNLKSKLGFALGVDTAGFPRYADLAKMPHLLIAGATGSGKSVCINTLITSILFRATYKDVRFLMIDPKRIELSFYEGIPHLVMPVIKERKEAARNLKKMVALMDLRYKHFARDGVRDIESHNNTVNERPGDEPLPYIVVIIDEFADLILTIGKEIEEPLAKLAQMARAVGIHLVVATQRPSVDVITGMIKANFPVRIAFKVPSRIDSKTILDEIGAEKLLGMGDMLFIPPGTSEPVRLHGPFISEEETKLISSKIAKEYLSLRLEELFPESHPGDLVELIVEKGFLPSLTRSDEPGLKERFEILVGRAARILKLDEELVKQKLSYLKSTYYPEIKELEDFDLLEDEEATEIAGLDEGYDPLLMDAARLVVQRKNASATFLQRRLKIGFARAARIIDQLEEIGIVGPPEGSKPREVLVGPEELEHRLRKLME